MISSKHISKITIILVSVVLALCLLAMGLSDRWLSAVSHTGYAMEYEDALFDTSKILEIDIMIDEAEWNDMLENATQEAYHECDVVINGTTFYQVGIRTKGNTSLSAIAMDPDNNRYSFKLEFDQYVDGQTCFGLDKLVLNNNYADTTNMKEAIVYDMFQYLNTDASLYNYAKISVNNEYWGVYLALEAVEESFMLRNYRTEKGYLYKPDSMNFGNNDDGQKPAGGGFPTPPEGGFQKPENFEGLEQNQEIQPDFDSEAGAATANNTPSQNEGDIRVQGTQDKPSEKDSFPGGNSVGGFPGGMGGGSNLNYSDDDLDSYTEIWDGQVNDSTDADHKRVVEALKNIHERTDIEKYIDVDQILKYMAVHNFSVNEDSLSGGMAHNYYLYEANGRISILPWDYNLAFGGMNGGDGTSVANEPIDDSWQATQLFDFILEDEEYKARYHEYYNKLVDEYLYGDGFEETYNRIRSQIDSLVKTDPNAMYSYEEYDNGAKILYELVMLRAESIKGQLDGTIPSTSEGQKADASSLVDASHINLSDLGQFMGGGFGGGFGGENREISENNQSSVEKQVLKARQTYAAPFSSGFVFLFL